MKNYHVSDMSSTQYITTANESNVISGLTYHMFDGNATVGVISNDVYHMFDKITATGVISNNVSPTLYKCNYCDCISDIPGTCRHCGAPLSILTHNK